MLKATLVGDRELKAKFDALPGEVNAALKESVGRACLLVVARTKRKLSDDVLRVKTGRLRRSINHQVSGSGSAVEGVVGTNVKYGRIHELGFQGTVTVKEHLRRARKGSTATSEGVRAALSNAVSSTRQSIMGTVRAHSRKVNLPERSFLRSSLRELQPEIRAEFEKALAPRLPK